MAPATTAARETTPHYHDLPIKASRERPDKAKKSQMLHQRIPPETTRTLRPREQSSTPFVKIHRPSSPINHRQKENASRALRDRHSIHTRQISIPQTHICQTTSPIRWRTKAPNKRKETRANPLRNTIRRILLSARMHHTPPDKRVQAIRRRPMPVRKAHKHQPHDAHLPQHR